MEMEHKEATYLQAKLTELGPYLGSCLPSWQYQETTRQYTTMSFEGAYTSLIQPTVPQLPLANYSNTNDLEDHHKEYDD